MVHNKTNKKNLVLQILASLAYFSNFVNYKYIFNSLSHQDAVDVYPQFQNFCSALNDFKIKGFIKFSFLRCLCPSWSRDLSHYIACEESSRNQHEFSA